MITEYLVSRSYGATGIKRCKEIEPTRREGLGPVGEHSNGYEQEEVSVG